MAFDMTSIEWAVDRFASVIGDDPTGQTLVDLLEETALQWDGITYYQPLEAATRTLLRPDAATQESRGDASRTLVDPTKIAAGFRADQRVMNKKIPGWWALNRQASQSVPSTGEF